MVFRFFIAFSGILVWYKYRPGMIIDNRKGTASVEAAPPE
jgi:hypothetical protein